DLETEEGEIALSFGADLAGLPQRVHADRGPAGWVWRDQTPRADVLSATESHPTYRYLYDLGFRSIAWFPLSTPRARLGTFAVARHSPEALAPNAARLVSWVVSVVALAIEHTRQVESLERLSEQVSS